MVNKGLTFCWHPKGCLRVPHALLELLKCHLPDKRVGLTLWRLCVSIYSSALEPGA
jgi:hypothetical protein